MNNKAHLRPKDFDRNGDIIPDALQEEKEVRLINANALKVKNVAEVNGKLTHVLLPEDIANAPTISPYKAIHDELHKGEENEHL